MPENKENKELNNEELENINGGMKIVTIDDESEELSWWEKLLKIFFKTK